MNAQTLSPADRKIIAWMEAQGARFCKVSAHDDTGTSPGKKPIERGWQDKPLTLPQVLHHIQGGGNLGMICGQHSGGLCMLDIDQEFIEFCHTFPALVDHAQVVRDDPNKAKLLIQVSDEIPQPEKWKLDGDKHPFMELLSTGNQGVIPPSIHPSGEAYRLINQDRGILTLSAVELRDVTEFWALYMRERHFQPPPEAPAPITREHSAQENGSGLREKVREHWTPLQVFEHFGLAKNGTQEQGEWIRIFGNGGLFAHKNGSTWAQPGGGKGAGGDVFDAWYFAKTNGVKFKVPPTEFYKILCEMASAAGVEIPTHTPDTTPPPPENFVESLPDIEIITPEADQPTQPAPRPVDRWLIHTAAEALLPQPPIDWIIEPLLSAGSVSLIVGEGGSKKTWSMLDAGICVAQGAPWLQFKTSQGAVLIIDEESGPRRLARRLGDGLRGHFAGEETPIFYTTLNQANLRNVEDCQVIDNMILQTQARFVIMDALADLAAGADENAVKDMQPIFLALRGIAERRQCAIMVIHHTNKLGGYRGSTAMKGAVDVMLTCNSAPDSLNLDFATEKNRDGEPLKFSATATWQDGLFYLSSSESTTIQRMPKSQAFVMRFLKDNGNSEMDTIIAAADTCSAASAKKAIYDLAGLGYVRRADNGKQGQKALYGLSEKGRAYQID